MRKKQQFKIISLQNLFFYESGIAPIDSISLSRLQHSQYSNVKKIWNHSKMFFVLPSFIHKRNNWHNYGGKLQNSLTSTNLINKDALAISDS